MEIVNQLSKFIEKYTSFEYFNHIIRVINMRRGGKNRDGEVMG